jgi:PleD family two-component response regulator
MERSAPAASQPSPVILVANPEEWFSRSLESILTPAGYIVTRTYTGASTVAEMRRAPPDAILLAVELPDVNGYVLCRTLRGDPAITDSTPILLTNAGPTSLQLRLDALRAGACDLFGQPLDGDEFVLRLASHLRAKADADRARQDALVDRGTGLYSPRGLERQLVEVSARAIRAGAPLACVVFAVDGPNGGASAELERVGRAIRECARQADIAARTDAGEFAILAPGVTGDGARCMVKRLSELLKHRTGIEVRAAAAAIQNCAATPRDVPHLVARASAELARPHGETP